MAKIPRITEEHLASVRGNRVQYFLEIVHISNNTRLQGILIVEGKRKVIAQTVPAGDPGSLEALRSWADMAVADFYEELHPDEWLN